MNIAMISAWHVHAGSYANAIRENGETVYAVWDEIPERGRKWAEELGAKYYVSYDELLADPAIDGIVCCAPTDRHGELLFRAANAGKHIFTEKVLTLTNEEAEAVREAVKKNHVRFTISFPHETNPRLLAAKRMIDEGQLGQITYARIRNCHSGSIRDWLPPHFYDRKQCGGGAMIDLGAHPMYLLQWLLGDAKRVVSCFVNATDRPAEDNAVSVIEFEHGALGVSETGFVSVTDPFIAEVSGTKGYLKIDRTFSYQLEGGEYTVVNDADLTDSRPGPIPYWLDSIRGKNENEYYTIDEAVALTRLMAAAYRASGESVKADV